MTNMHSRTEYLGLNFYEFKGQLALMGEKKKLYALEFV